MELERRSKYIEALKRRIQKSISLGHNPEDIAHDIFAEILDPAVQEEAETWIKLIYDRYHYEQHSGGH